MKKNLTIMAAMLMVIHISNAQWTNLGLTRHPLNANNIINSVVTDISGNVYAAGEFTIRDSAVQYYVAKWTGDTAWAPLDTGSHAWYANGYIYSLATDPSGHVYAAGAFTDQQYQNAGNLYVAKWVDTGWIELGPGGVSAVTSAFGSAIYSIVVDNSGNVYAAGEFKDGSGNYYVAKWNGTTWSELGTGSNALKANAYIRTLSIGTSGSLYAAGAFTDAAGYRYVAEWNGSAWSEMGTGSNALLATSPIQAIATDRSGNVYVGYDDTAANYYVAQWNGTNWNQVSSGSSTLNANNTINALTTDGAGNLYAAGNFTDNNGEQYVAMWNGTNWRELGTGINSLDPDGYILSIATDTAYNVYAAGYFTQGGPKNYYYVAQYDPNTQDTTTGINKPLASINQVYLSPNPAYGQTSMTLSISTSASINVELYDITGRMLATVYDGQMDAGQKSLPLDTEHLSSGIYLVRVSDGSSSVQKRFVKL